MQTTMSSHYDGKMSCCVRISFLPQENKHSYREGEGEGGQDVGEIRVQV